MTIKIWLNGTPPTVTDQEHRVGVRKDGTRYFYRSDKLQNARSELKRKLEPYAPEEKLQGPVRLVVKWCFPLMGHRNGQYKTTKPDTDNLDKMLKDVMTECGFWKDDAQVASEIIEKFWSEKEGIWIEVSEIE